MAKESILSYISKQVHAHGSQRAYAKHLGVSQAYLSDVINGRRDVSAELALLLGFERVTTYVKAKAK